MLEQRPVRLLIINDGKGTGFGLLMRKELVGRNSGMINVRSAPDEA